MCPSRNTAIGRLNLHAWRDTISQIYNILGHAKRNKKTFAEKGLAKQKRLPYLFEMRRSTIFRYYKILVVWGMKKDTDFGYK